MSGVWVQALMVRGDSKDVGVEKAVRRQQQSQLLFCRHEGYIPSSTAGASVVCPC